MFRKAFPHQSFSLSVNVNHIPLSLPITFTKTTAFDTAFVRIPIAGSTVVDNLDWTQLSQQLQRPAFLEALYVASPALYEEAIKFDYSRQPDEKSRRVLYPLIKYLSRSATRSTPFGLFGGFTTLPLDTLVILSGVGTVLLSGFWLFAHQYTVIAKFMLSLLTVLSVLYGLIMLLILLGGNSSGWK
ncbi:hypothetical protein BH09BAC4_BH09BAC4_05060 [soil metagenome]